MHVLGFVYGKKKAAISFYFNSKPVLDLNNKYIWLCQRQVGEPCNKLHPVFGDQTGILFGERWC